MRSNKKFLVLLILIRMVCSVAAPNEENSTGNVFQAGVETVLHADIEETNLFGGTS